jgi:hypothetical protein
MIGENLDVESSQVPGERELTVLLANETDVSGFTRKLEALYEIYEELCSLLNVPLTSYPLRIGRIESGSLWAKVFGESRVIGLMIGLIESATHYFHRNFTKEGKIANIPRSVEAVDALLGLRERLEKQGLYTGELDNHISKSSILVAQKLSGLLAGEPNVTVNGIHLSVGAEVIEKARLAGGPKLLQETTPESLGEIDGSEAK